MKERYYVYVIECDDGSLYKGYTNDLARRYREHCSGRGALHTKLHKPVRLVYYYETTESLEEAEKREKFFKSGQGREFIKGKICIMRPHVIIYTDGGAAPNPGKGGWAAVLNSPSHKATREIYGSEPDTTNNRMELTAAIKALEALKVSCDVDLHTDSAYLQNAFVKKWLVKWQRNGWKNANKSPVLNRDLWEKLLSLTKIHNVTWHWVKGHADNKLNNRCDELVQIARNELS